MKKEKITKKKKRSMVQRKNIATMASITIVVLTILVVLLTARNDLSQKVSQGNIRKTELTKQIEQEEARAEEIENLEKYMQSDEYVEKMAREKAGLVKENEIIFKESD